MAYQSVTLLNSFLLFASINYFVYTSIEFKLYCQTYSGGDENKDFILNATTGQFYAARVLDREKTSSYRLVLVATDHGNPPRTAVGQVLVTVLDWNDHDPDFTRNVYEANVTESLSR